MKKFTPLFILVFAYCSLSFAQDIHYSQFYSSPLSLNPALTGINDCNYRVGVMYRNQWKSVSIPYKTPSISFDINNVLPKIIKSGILSLGVIVINDQAGEGALTNLSILGSIAYQHGFADNKFNLSLGVQGGYVQKRIDPSKLTFETQFNGTSFDPALSNGENIDDKFGYADFNAGIYLSYSPTHAVDIFLGDAQSHLTTPKETFLSGTNDLHLRTTIHGGLRIGVTDKLSIIPQALYLMQSKARETNLGLGLAYAFTPDVHLYAGVYDRIKDAIIPQIGFEYKRVRLGLSYDINTSSLHNIASGNSAFEISLMYTGCLGNITLDQPVMFCPRY
ncbi:MAG: PorP/SprF family type IX secretion system membrane protein [Chitinophagales bacterium]|nr:PorP/SprF family type IX secretion system membrane protein [Chitinophagales bacterium]